MVENWKYLVNVLHPPFSWVQDRRGAAAYLW